MKLIPIFKERIWGGNNLSENYLHVSRQACKSVVSGNNIGESWDVSALEGDDSVVENGFLAENTLSELVEVYMEEMVGEHVYEKYGREFPLLVKLLDAHEKLSIQVHPNDEMAAEVHGGRGKSEMWYVMAAEEGAHVVLGFERYVSKDEFLAKLQDGTLEEVLHKEPVAKGDVIYIPAGCIHAICGGVIVCEVQQSSDYTYRAYDYMRKDKDGNLRELHIDLAAQAIDYDNWQHRKVKYTLKRGEITPLVSCEHFTTNVMSVVEEKNYDLSEMDSFVVLTCLEGHISVMWDEGKLTLSDGETLLVPASVQSMRLVPTVDVKLLETYI